MGCTEMDTLWEFIRKFWRSSYTGALSIFLKKCSAVSFLLTFLMTLIANFYNEALLLIKYLNFVFQFLDPRVECLSLVDNEIREIDAVCCGHVALSFNKFYFFYLV